MSEDICFDLGRKAIVRASFFIISISISIASALARQRANATYPFQVFLLFASSFLLPLPSSSLGTCVQSCHRALHRLLRHRPL